MTADTGADDEDDAPSDAAVGDDPTTRDAEVGADEDEPTDGQATDGGQARAGSGAEARSEPRVDPEDVAAIAEAVDALGEDLEELETHVDERTVHRDDIRSELRRYVRKRQRRGHATGWGPYLVLFYGTAMTVAAFFYLGDIAAIVAMLVIWLSTLGLYVFMVVVGGFLGLGRRALGLRDLVSKFRE